MVVVVDLYKRPTILLSGSEARFYGLCHDAGVPVPGLELRLEVSDYGVVDETVTDERGYFTLTWLPPSTGTYRFTITNTEVDVPAEGVFTVLPRWAPIVSAIAVGGLGYLLYRKLKGRR